MGKEKSSKTPIIYVITRTSQRPYFFHQNYQSIHNQNYPHIRHYVSCDDDETEKYVQQYPEIKLFRVKRIPRQGNGHFPYNLYLNEMINSIPPDSKKTQSWIMFLDDDDIFPDDECVQILVDQILENQSKKTVFLWPVQFPNRLVPKRPFKKPSVGNFSMIGFLYPLHFRDQVQFQDRKGGDFLFINDLWPLIEPCWLDRILTQINYEKPRRVGSGQRNDISFKNVQKKEYKLSLSKYKEQMSEAQKPEIKLVPKIKPKLQLKATAERKEEKKEESEENNARSKARARIKEMLQSGPKVDLEQYESQSEDEKSAFSDLSQSEEHQELKAPFKMSQVKPIIKDNSKLPEVSKIQTIEQRIQISKPKMATNLISSPLIKTQQEVTGISKDEMKSLIRETLQETLRESLFKNLNDILPELLTNFVEKSKTLSMNSEIEPKHEEESEPRERLKELKKSKHSPEEQLSQLLQSSRKKKSVTIKEPDSEESEESEPRSRMKPAERKLTNLLVDYARQKEEYSHEEEHSQEEEYSQEYQSNEGGCDEINEYLDVIFILNLHGLAGELQAELESYGLNNVQPVDGNTKKTFYDNLWDLAKICKKRKYERVAVLQDDIHLHNDFANEILYHLPKMQETDWKLIALSASQNLAPQAELDWEFYLETYPDLEKAKITTQSKAKQHWKIYGIKEKRYPQHDLVEPDLMTSVTGVIFSSHLYEDLSKLKGSRNPAEYLVRSCKHQLYATCPLLAINRADRLTLRRNRPNLGLYNINLSG